MKKGDILIYYSPKISLNSDVKFQEITAIGKIKDENVYQFQMTENFIPYRRDVDYLKLNGKCTIKWIEEPPWMDKIRKAAKIWSFWNIRRFFRFIYDLIK